MDDNNHSIEGFSVDMKYRCDGRTRRGVVCSTRNSFMYQISSNLVENELEVIWLKIKPKKILKQLSRIPTTLLSKGEDVVVCLPGVRIEHLAERLEQMMGRGNGGSILVHIGTNNADKKEHQQ